MRRLAALALVLAACAGASGEDDASEAPNYAFADDGPVRTPDADAPPGDAAGPSEPEVEGPEPEAGPEPEPVELAFTVAPPELVEAPDAPEVRDAVPYDVDADGDLDVVVATDDGLRLLLAEGGALGLARAGEEPLRPLGRGDVRDLATGDVDGDGSDELIVCTGAGKDWVVEGTPGGLAVSVDVPWRRGACLAATVLTAGPKGPAVATLVEPPDGPAAVMVRSGEAHALVDGVLLAPDVGGPLGAATSDEPEAQVSLERVPGVGMDGGVAGHLAWSLPEAGGEAFFTLPTALAEVPAELHLAVRGAPDVAEVRLRLTDEAGTSAESPTLAPTTTSWDSWEVAIDGAALAAPVVELSVVVTSAGAGELWLDDVVAWTPGVMPGLVEGFERPQPRFEVDGAAGLLAGGLDGDAVTDLLVLGGGGDDPVWRMASGGAPATAPWGLLPSMAAGPGPFAAGAVADVEGDGDGDLLLVSSGGQDRLLIGDGWGALLDATLGAVPVDQSEGTACAVTDLNADGAADWVIGNRGATDRLYLGLGDGRFADHTPVLGFDTLETAAIVLVDADGDGDTDVLSLPADGTDAPLLRAAVEAGP